MPRWLDLVLAGLLLLLCAPVLLVGALAVLALSGRPVLFRQRRVGRGGTTFVLLKLRTMTSAQAGSPLTADQDRRVTRPGGVLRRYRVDELPQLLNVLRGDMALVGPRPELPALLGTALSADLVEVLRRRPGITDPASIAFREEAQMLAGCVDPLERYRTEIQPAKWRISADYSRSRTTASDLLVLLRTAQCLLPHRSGASRLAAEQVRRDGPPWARTLPRG